MKAFVTRYPLLFSVLLTLVLLGLALASDAALPRAVISTAEDLSPEAVAVPSTGEQILTALWNFENLFWVLASVLALALILGLGWWREAGFNEPSRWRNLRLLVFPLLVGGLALAGGIRFGGFLLLGATLLGVVVAAFGEEALYRGVAWRALAPTGLMRAVILTALLAGALRFGVSMLANTWPEAVQAAVLAVCGGFTYGALRWRTASIWPVVLLHCALGFAGAVSAPGAAQYLLVLLISTFGFVFYGLFLLRNPRVRADGG